MLPLPLVPLLLFVPLLMLLLLLVLFVLFVVLLTFGCNCTVMLVGGFTPRVRFLSLLICRIATSTTTSGFDLSRSVTSFSANATWSGVPRTTMAPSEGRG